MFDGGFKLEKTKDGRLIILTDTAQLLKLIGCLKTTMKFNLLTSITGVDYPDDESIVCVYHLASTSNKDFIIVKVSAKRSEARIPSIISLFKNAEWFEREIHEMLGVRFEGNPNMNRLLLPEGWSKGYPLRKDFTLN